MVAWQTVCPLSNFTLDFGPSVEFAQGVVLGPKPDWVSKEVLLDDCGKFDRASAQKATVALVAHYSAGSFGDADPDWKGPAPRSIHESKYELCLLANLALWVARPNPAGFRVVLHGREFGDQMIAQRVESGHPPLLCLEQDRHTTLTAADLQLASLLHSSLVGVGRSGSIWTAARSVWASLHVNRADIRYLFFWVALEALFGPTASGEITHKIAERLAFFLEPERPKAKELFKAIKVGYGFRSKIAHGDMGGDAQESLARMAEVEDWVRRSLLKILASNELVSVFAGKDRDMYLTDLLFQA